MPREIRIDIRTGLDEPRPPAHALESDKHMMECWDAIYVCGHFLTGEPYYCSVTVYEVVETITVTPS